MGMDMDMNGLRKKFCARLSIFFLGKDKGRSREKVQDLFPFV